MHHLVVGEPCPDSRWQGQIIITVEGSFVKSWTQARNLDLGNFPFTRLPFLLENGGKGLKVSIKEGSGLGAEAEF